MTVTDLLQVVPTRLVYRLFVTSCYELVGINLSRADDVGLIETTAVINLVTRLIIYIQ